MTTKRLILVWVMILCLVPFAAAADGIPLEKWEQSKAFVQQEATEAYPGWTIIGTSAYGSGTWHDERALNVDVMLYRIEDNTLFFLELHVLANPLCEGEPIEWNENHLAPVPLDTDSTDNISETISQLEYPDETGTPWLSSPSGFAAFMLSEGEHWEELGAMSHELVGVAVDAEGRKGLRIAAWDGSSFGAVIASPMAETDYKLDTFHSGNRALILWFGRDYKAYVVRDDDGTWRWAGVNNGHTVYWFYDLYMLDDYPTLHDSNNNRHYGHLTLPQTLDALEIDRMVFRGPQLVQLLDAEGWACVRENETPLYSSPDGEITALCYSRLAGRIVTEENNWVCLQIGSVEHGLKAWFHRDHLAYGSEIEEIHCGFPVYEAETVDEYSWRPDLTSFVNRVLDQTSGPFDLNEDLENVWIIGRSPDGRWLMEVEEDVVAFIRMDAMIETQSAPEYEIPLDFLLTDAEWEALYCQVRF